jgi:putative ABC transport system permease protein
MLLLARNADRVRESAIRVALGARRTRLIRQALTESLVLALAGGLVGVALSYWGLRAVLALAPADLPRLSEVKLDGGVLAAAFVMSTIAGLAFGILPALRFGAADPGELLKAGGRTSTEGRRGVQSRSVLIASQVALSTVLLVATGLLITSFVRVMGVDRGFDAERVLALDVLLPQAGYDSMGKRFQFYQQSLDRLRAIPGVTSAALTSGLPLEGETEVHDLSTENDTRPFAERPLTNVRWVSPDYFSTMGTPIRRGRAPAESDRGRYVAVLSEGAARALWPHADPIGKQVVTNKVLPAEVIGVVADMPTSSLEEKGSLVLYYPYWQTFPSWPDPSWSGSMLVRTAGDPATVATVARARLREVDPNVLVTKVRTMAQVVSASVAQRRFQLVLLVLFAVTALVTASIGIYGTTTYAVVRRANELGIRMILGAHSEDIHWLVMRDGLKPVAVGLAVGILVSLAVGRAFTSLLFEVHPSDPLTLVGVAVLLAGVAAAACYLPGRRATNADPIASLRLE